MQSLVPIPLSKKKLFSQIDSRTNFLERDEYTKYIIFKFARLARSPFVLTEHISSWRASEASKTLSGVMQSRFRYIYIFFYLFIWYVGPLFPPELLITSW